MENQNDQQYQPSQQSPNGLPQRQFTEPVAPSQPQPQPQPTGPAFMPAQPSQQLPPQPAASKKSKLPLIIIAAVVLLTVLAGGAFAMYSSLNNKPEKVLADALSNTASDVLSDKPTTAVGSLSFESKAETPLKVTLNFDAKASGSNSSGSLDASVTLAGQVYKLKTSVAGFGDSEYYFKIENLKQTVASIKNTQPEFATYTQYIDPLVNKLDNQWIKVTKDDLKQLSGVSETSVDKCSAALSNIKLSKGDQKKLKSLFKNNQFIVASEKLTTEKVADEDSFHYKLDFNNKAAVSFAKQVVALDSFKTLKADCDISDSKIDDSLKADTTDKTGDVKPVVELWVSKSTRRPTKFRVSGQDKDMTLDFSSQFKFNATNITIDKPSNAESINDLKADFEKILPSSTSNLESL